MAKKTAPKQEGSSSTSSEPKRKIDKRPWLKNKPNGGEIPVPVSANPFVVNISMATEPGQQPLDFKVSDYAKEGNEDGRA